MAIDTSNLSKVNPNNYLNNISNFTASNFFPYIPRPHQIAMMDFLRNELSSKRHLIIEAANGTGKTIAVLAEALDYIRNKNKKGRKLRIGYLTRTHNQSDRVIEEILEMKGGLNVKAIAKRGRQALCIEKTVMNSPSKYFIKNCEDMKKNNRCLPYRNFAEKRKVVNKLIGDILVFPADSEVIKEEYTAHNICPAEMSNNLLKHVDVVASSYLYIFDPTIRKSFLRSMNCKLEDLILIIDECHNLPQVVYDLGNKRFNDKTIISAKRDAKKYCQELSPFLHEFGLQLQNRAFNLQDKNKYEMIIENDPFYDMIWEIAEQTHNASEIDPLEDIIKLLLRTGSKVRHALLNEGKLPYSSLTVLGEFLAQLWNLFTQDNIIISMYNHREHGSRKKNYTQTKQQYSLLLAQLDPSLLIKPILKKSHSTIHMSGSIGNNGFAYKAMTGIHFLDHKLLLLPSPYDPANILIMVVQGLGTQYKLRTQKMYNTMAGIIKLVMENTRENAGLFVPSYDILKQLKKAGLKTIKKPLFFADQGMTSEQTDKLIEAYKATKKHGALLTSVMSGRSSEGTDFSGKDMEFVFLVGLPYEPMSTILKRRIEYFDKIYEKSGKKLGWQIVYGSKAWQHLSQAAGRPLRSLKDRVCVIIMEERVKSAAKGINNLYCLPGWMRNVEEVKAYPELILSKINTFFSE